MPELTHERLLQLVRYNAESGEFERLTKARKPKDGGIGHVNVYRYFHVDGKRYAAHRLAWLYVYGEWPSSELDHVNGDKLDNRIENLRLATRAENNANTKCRSKVGLKGVVKVRNRYRAGITIDRQFHYIGLFATAEEAHAAYLVRAQMAFGEFHRAA